LFKLQTMRG